MYHSALLSTVKGKLRALMAIAALTLLLVGFCSLSALNTVKVGSPLYQHLAQTLNLRADIRPPRQSLIETALTAFEMQADVFSNGTDRSLGLNEAKLRQLQKNFDAAQQSWNAQLPGESELERKTRVLLLEKNADVCGEFFKVLMGEFVPALKAHDQKLANDILNGSLKQLAFKHQAIIQQLLSLTEQSVSEDEQRAMGVVRWRVLIAVLFTLLGGAAGVALSLYILRSMDRPLAEAMSTIQSLEQGNFTARAGVSSHDEIGRMCESLNRAIDFVHQALRGAVESSLHLGGYSDSLSSVANSVNAGVGRQSSNLEQTSVQLSEVASLSQSIASGSREGQDAAERSTEAAEQGSKVVEAAIAGMTAISKSAAEITQIVDAVDEISFNTNLLAVNASVEAAVAGDHGRGFKVVAEEIRSLSLRTAAAGKKIRKLVQDSHDAIAQGTDRVEASGHAFDDVTLSVRRMKAIMDDIAASSTIQADSLSRLNEAVANIADVVDQNSAGTRTINQTSADLALQARNMQTLVGTFRLD